MIKQLKRLTTQMLAGANIATIVVMLLVGFSDRLNPADHPMLSTIGMTFPILLLANMMFLISWLLFKWRMAWLPVVGYLLAYVPISIYLPINPKKDVPEGAMKVISYNVCAYGGNYKYENGFEVVRDYIRQEKPDIVCMQEDVDTWRRVVYKDYEVTLPYNDTLVIANKPTSFNALGIHTRFPIIKRERIDYPSEANGSAAWWLQVEDDTLIVVNNHFESCHLSSNDRRQYRQMLKGEMGRDSIGAESKILLIKLAEANAKRSHQIDAVKRYVTAHSQYPIIACGDFNDNPISYSHYALSQILTDSYAMTGRGLGLSYNQKAFSLRIDHLFCSSRVEPYNCKIDSKMDASDHYPLVCWLKIKPKR